MIAELEYISNLHRVCLLWKWYIIFYSLTIESIHRLHFYNSRIELIHPIKLEGFEFDCYVLEIICSKFCNAIVQESVYPDLFIGEIILDNTGNSLESKPLCCFKSSVACNDGVG